MIRLPKERVASDPLGPVSLEMNQRIDAVCLQFEADWREAHQAARDKLVGKLTEDSVARPRPQLQSYLAGVIEPERSCLLAELLILDLDLRSTLAHEQPTEADYSDSFPADVGVISEVFRRWLDESDEQPPTGIFPRPTGTLPQPTVEGYEIIDVLGRGGMGVVYNALDRRLKRRVALKMLLAGHHAGADHLARLRTEAEIVARLKHPNIVQIFDIGEQDGHPYLTFELVEGVTLAEFTRREPQPPTLAAELVEVIALAIDYAHQQGIVHRDLKPANVLLEGATCGQGSTIVAHYETVSEHAPRKSSSSASALSGRQATIDGLTPKITDFGLAKVLDAEADYTISGTVLGTTQFMSPEQAEGRVRDVGPASDIYSLGAILYVLLTGQPPFLGTTPIETLKMVVGSQPVPPTRLQPRLAKDLETICLKCLHKDPARRYATAGDLAEDLRRFRNHKPILARASGRIEKTWRWCRRKASMAVSIAFALLILMAGVAVSSYSTNRMENQPNEAAAVSERPTAAATEGEQVPQDVEPVVPRVPATDVASTIDESAPPEPVASPPQPIRPYAWPADAPPLAIAPFDAVQAKQHQQAWADYLKLPVETTNSIGMKFVLIPPGEFLMGVEPSEIDFTKLELVGEQVKEFEDAMSRATPQHWVRITRPYYLQSHEVTFGLFEKVLGSLPEGAESAKLDFAAHWNISLLDAVAFCNALSKSESRSLAHRINGDQLTRVLDANGYRLPTEAEWEHSCRAGTTTLWFFGEDPHGDGAEYSSVLKEYQTRWHGSNVKANPFGLFDMYAGSSEWCFDRYVPFRSEDVVDPFTDPGSGTVVCRGGSVFAGSGNSVTVNNSFSREELTNSTKLYQGLGRVLLPIPSPDAASARHSDQDNAPASPHAAASLDAT